MSYVRTPSGLLIPASLARLPAGRLLSLGRSIAGGAFANEPGGAWIPDYQYYNGTPVLNVVTLDAAADRAAVVFKAFKSVNYNKIEVRIGTVTTLGATSTIQVGFQGVDVATGNPDEVFTQSFTIPTASIVSNTTYKGTLGAVQAVTRGTRYALVAQYGTFNTGDVVAMNPGLNIAIRGGPNYDSYALSNTTGSWLKEQGVIPGWSLEDDSGAYPYIPDVYPVSVGANVNFSNASTPDAIGLRFQVPTPRKIGACWLNVDADSNLDVVLYTATGRTIVASMDKDIRNTTVARVGPISFNAEQTLDANTTYVLALEPTSTTVIGLRYVDVSAAAVLDQMNGRSGFHYATAKDPATTADFTMTTTRRPLIGLHCTAFDDGVSTGGGPRQQPQWRWHARQ